MAEKHEFGPFVPKIGSTFRRADLEFYGIDHFCASYVARVFLNDRSVTPANASEDRPSYAGRFSIFGHERCSGDEGHCEAHAARRRFDDRRSHPLTRAFKRVTITDALRRALATRKQLTVTVIVTSEADGKAGRRGAAKGRARRPSRRLLDIRGVQLVTFD
jgi:hypothetical protein